MPLSFRQAGNLFTAGPNINIYPSGNTFAISGSPAGILSGTNVGTGTGIFCGLTTTNNTNDTLAFYNLSGGNEVGISINDNNEIVVVRGRTVVNTVSNQGGGARIFSGVVGNSLVNRTMLTQFGFTAALANNPNVTGATSAITANTIVTIAPTNTTALFAYITDASNNLSRFGTTSNLVPGIGNFTIWNTSNLISNLTITPSTTTGLTSIKFTESPTEPVSPADGSIWYTTANELKMQRGGIATEFIFMNSNNAFSGGTQKLLFVDTSGTISINDSTIGKPRYMNSFGIFNTLSSVTISNTTAETSFISSAITGSTTLFASTNEFNPELIIGKKYRFNAKGTISIQNVDTNLNIIMKFGSVIISSSSTITIPGSVNPYDGDIEIDYTFTVRNSGLIVGSGKIVFPTGPPSSIGGDPIIFGIYSQNQTIITTSNQVFDCTAQFDVADSGSSIIINESTLEILN